MDPKHVVMVAIQHPFESLPDPRVLRTKKHPLMSVRLLASPHRFLVNPKSHRGENASYAKLDAQVRAAWGVTGPAFAYVRHAHPRSPQLPCIHGVCEGVAAIDLAVDIDLADPIAELAVRALRIGLLR